ncbi:hypothetical protein BDB00DRAFT_81152 [Zychaea mexicana]|uniref:uncharacterized protein n=1 Tax=Zychaea mexicana TaxID=64656 RepID=UPI0022FE8994|nr:uncharacterized protein BDB00DRAFT_81152 [Zychaea mexicana]KAI9487991.1 hypothetical protein BDB00DRAFT_81152 [Zychaea mexicana]
MDKYQNPRNIELIWPNVPINEQQTCKKAFKRPQDLKKHERIHTIEHKASLLSNQPGYKPVRRRRNTQQQQQRQQQPITNVTQVSKPATISSTNPQSRSLSTSTSRNDGDTDAGYFSEMLTGSSPSSYRGSANSSTSYHLTTETEDDDGNDSDSTYVTRVRNNSENNTTFKMERQRGAACTEDNLNNNKNSNSSSSSNSSNVASDALQNFLYDAIQSTTLSPDYDTEMMERLDSISHELQRQQFNNWTAPVNDPNDINTLQNWLEQLSANIQTDVCLYPEITSPYQLATAGVTMPSNPDNELYPSAEATIPDWKAMMMTYSDNPLAATLLEQQQQKNKSDLTHGMPPSVHSSGNTLSSSNSNMNGAASSLGASFFTPGNSAEVEIQPMEDAGPSEAIEFESSATTMVYSKPQPLHLFESSKEETETAKQNVQSTLHSDKRSMMHMLNAFTAPAAADDDDNTKERAVQVSKVSPRAVATNDRHEAPSLPQKDKDEKKRVGDGDHDNEEQFTEETLRLPPIATSTAKTTLETRLNSRDSITQLLFSKIVDEKSPTMQEHDSKHRQELGKNSSRDRNNGSGGSPSPYAELADKLRDLTVDADNKSAEECARQRHAAIVDRLWEAVLRAKKAANNKNATKHRKSPPPSTFNVRDTTTTATDAQQQQQKHYQDVQTPLVSV